MRLRLTFGLFLLSSVITSGLTDEKVKHAPVLKLPLLPTSRTNIPLARALSEIGILVRGGYVLFGIELLLKDGKEPNVNLHLESGGTLETALKHVFDQLPGYTYEVISNHMIDVYPKGAKGDPRDLLNLHVPRFDAVAAHPDHIIAEPDDLIPELQAHLRPKPMTLEGYGYGGKAFVGMWPTVTFHLANVTVREVLNAASQATLQLPTKNTPFGWIYSFSPAPSSPIAGIHSWNFHLSLRNNWKEEVEKGNRRLHP